MARHPAAPSLVCGLGRRAVLAAAVALAGVLAGCNGEEITPDEEGMDAYSEETEIDVEDPVQVARRAAIEAAQAAAQAGYLRHVEQEVEARVRASDWWFSQFGRYMAPEVRARYLATPPHDRLREFGVELLDFQRREILVAPYRDRMTPDELDAYYHLPSFDACRRFLDQHFPPLPGSRGR